MSSRIERAPITELELSVYSEMNFEAIDFFFSETRIQKLKREVLTALGTIAFFAAMGWVYLWGATRGR